MTLKRPTAGRLFAGVLISAASALLVWSISSCDQRVREAASREDLKATETRVREDIRTLGGRVDSLIDTLLRRQTASETTNVRRSFDPEARR